MSSRAIGAALQEAAHGPLLTGRDHLRLQMAMHGIGGDERKRRADALLERVGLTEASDRRVNGYSGGMKRRLDLALALVHGPRILFLDEPTTGLDPQSRAALWEEVNRLARDEGVTVFLTTQYLEEADQLCDRLGIIAAGKIVAEGTPAVLKAEVGRPHLDLVLARGSDLARAREVVTRFGDQRPTSEGCHLSIALERGAADIAPILRALDDEDFVVAELELKQPTLDDVFLNKTGEHLEGAEEAEQEGILAPEPA